MQLRIGYAGRRPARQVPELSPHNFLEDPQPPAGYPEFLYALCQATTKALKRRLSLHTSTVQVDDSKSQGAATAIYGTVQCCR